MTKPCRLLSVDWDYFFRVVEHSSQPEFAKGDWMLYDWGHSEAHPDSLQDFLWGSRAADFERRKMALPTCEGWRGWWSRFTLAAGAPVFVADSHRFAALVADQMRVRFTEVWNFDAHHDAGYRDRGRTRTAVRAGRVSCEDWMGWYATQRARLFQRYPTWRSYWTEIEPVPAWLVDRATDDPTRLVTEQFDVVFICRSGSWTPPWCDDDFATFVTAAQTAARGERTYLQEVDDRSGWKQIRDAMRAAQERFGLPGSGKTE